MVLGSQASLSLVLSDEAQAEAWYARAWQHINEFEQRFSRFLPDSELAQVNSHSGEWVAVSQQFLEMIDLCRQWHRLTGGIFNPFVLPSLQALGYKNSWLTPQESINPILDVSSRALMQFDMLEVASGRVRVPANAALDFGGIGKGYMLDQLARLCEQNDGIYNYCLSLGGDIICRGHDANKSHWTIAVLDSAAQPTAMSVVNAKGKKMAAASSGTGKGKGMSWRHIIDPSTGMPSASNITLATVVAENGVAADVLAKTLVIDPLMAEQPEIKTMIHEYIFQTSAGEIIRSSEPPKTDD